MEYSFVFWGLIIFVIILLITGYHYLPRKKNFYVFSIVILGSLCSIIIFWHPQQKNVLTEQQKMQIYGEQSFFVTWYEEYKKYIEEGDLVWRRYNIIINEFNNGKLSVEIAKNKLIKLENESDKLQKKIQLALPPKGLSNINYNLANTVLKKTKKYTAGQNKTIKLTVKELNGDEFIEKKHDEQYKQLDNIRILNAPVELNIADDINTIKNNLSLEK